MTDIKAECILNARILPEIYAEEIIKYFRMALELGQNSQWGITKSEERQKIGCNHWLMQVKVGNRAYTPNLCFKSRKEAQDYVEAVGKVFPYVAQRMLGKRAVKYSPN